MYTHVFGTIWIALRSFEGNRKTTQALGATRPNIFKDSKLNQSQPQPLSSGHAALFSSTSASGDIFRSASRLRYAYRYRPFMQDGPLELATGASRASFH
jgi:hypothetical protein